MHQQLLHLLEGLPRTRSLALDLLRSSARELWLNVSIVFVSLIALEQALPHKMTPTISSSSVIQNERHNTAPTANYPVTTNNYISSIKDVHNSLIPNLTANIVSRITNTIKEHLSDSALANSRLTVNYSDQFDNLVISNQDMAFLVDKDYKLRFTTSDQIKEYEYRQIYSMQQLLHKLPSSIAKQCQSRKSEVNLSGVAYVKYHTPGPSHKDYKLLELTTGFVRPVGRARVTSRFGLRVEPFSSGSNAKKSIHYGMDFSAPTGTPVQAACGGKVVVAETRPGYGNVIMVQNGANRFVYAHLSKMLVKQGDIVQSAQVIGKVGSTGRSTAPHLHFEIRCNGKHVDPEKYLRK